LQSFSLSMRRFLSSRDSMAVLVDACARRFSRSNYPQIRV
jgi:hypothetical protein